MSRTCNTCTLILEYLRSNKNEIHTRTKNAICSDIFDIILSYMFSDIILYRCHCYNIKHKP